MTWLDLIPIIARYGITFAYELWQIAKDKNQPTEADWQSLIALANKPMSSYLSDAEGRAKLAETAAKLSAFTAPPP